MPSLHDHCRAILESPDLASKLAVPDEPLWDTPGPARGPDAPARTPELALVGGADPLPRPGELGDAAARARCLARFAHHELMAVELFAWALLRWPSLPGELRRGWLGILRDEQRHCRMYLGRLADHGSSLSEHRLSGYFWRHARTIACAPDPPRAFLAAMGLTLEQANLDFSLVYRDAFRAAGDERSARVCQEVHDDEIGHVRFARDWLLRLSPGAEGDAEVYECVVPFPFSAARAKGRRFDAAARRRAGFSEAFVEHVRDARSSQETRPVGRS